MRVIDGDTIEVSISGRAYHVRYIGIDTPETVAPGQPIGSMGAEATAANRSLVEGKTVYLEKDVSETDMYGRLLRYVYVGNLFVNQELVRQGFAQVSTCPPDVKYQSLFLQAQQEARNAGRGLWSATPTPVTRSVPVSGCPQGCVSPPPGCAIKGNISNTTNEKIYHMPGQQFYDETIIDPKKGERWFCTEQEAVANGWRRSKR